MHTSLPDGQRVAGLDSPVEVFDHLDELYCLLTPEMELVQWNDRLVEATGRDHEGLAGVTVPELCVDSDRPAVRDALTTATAEGRPVTVGAGLVGTDERRRDYDLSVSPVRDDGHVTALAVLGRERDDGTDAPAAGPGKVALDEVIDAVPHPLYVLDAETYAVERANSKAVATEGQHCYEVSHQRDTPCDEGEGATHPCPLTDVVETSEAATVEHTHYDADGNSRIHEVHAAPIVDGDGEVEAIVESLVDVTEREAVQRRLTEQRDNLDLLNQVLRHDIRNDLQLVTAYADLLREALDGDEREYAATILESADHAVELTTAARDMADVMLTEDDVKLRVSLRSALESELDEVRSTYSDALITVEGAIPPVHVLASDMLASVFRNLLKNAIQHNDKALPEVTVSTTTDEETVTVRVADNGPGVADEMKSEIFGRGESGLDSAGTGIGLYLVETLVDSYGGDVWVEDNDPTGAVFVVELQRVG